MSNAQKGCYLDADIFIDFINGLGEEAKQAKRYQASKAIIDRAKNGEIQIYTSVLTEVEVHSQGTLSVPNTEYLNEFFDSGWIAPIAVTRGIAREARNLIWDNPTLRREPNDAIHLASALHQEEVEVLYTRDGKLLELKDSMKRHRFGSVSIEKP